MKTISQVASDLYKFFTESDNKKTKSYDTKAEVLRTDGDTVWVKIPGGIDETPVAKTNNANPGDQVMVRVSGGRAWLLGNETSPATDDTRANYAVEQSGDAIDMANISRLAADIAQESANEAVKNAAIAKATTDEINAYAETAEKTVTQILQDGEDALSSAEQARHDAATASYNLSIVEDIVGTLNWLSQHGLYVVSQDQNVDDNKIYYTLTGTAIVNPSGNPKTSGYYELVNNIYIASIDTIPDPQKTYYQITATVVLEPSGNPSTNPYYELKVDEAITQYINMHLALTDNGLRISDGSNASLVINPNSGVTIYNGSIIMAQYGNGAIIGDPNKYHIEITDDRLSFMYGTGASQTEIAYMTGYELYIPRVVVVDSMQIGYWIWDAISVENHLTLKWRG